MKDSIISLIAFSNTGEDGSVRGCAAALSYTLLLFTSSALLLETESTALCPPLPLPVLAELK